MKIVAEIGLHHDGSLGTALAYVDACAKAGVDAVKAQCHYKNPVNQFRPGANFPQDADRQSYWQRTAFTIDQWKVVRDRCHANGVEFGLSVFAPEAVKWLRDGNCEPDFWKLGSGVSTRPEFANLLKDSEVVVSFGMSTKAEADAALRKFSVGTTTLLHCVSEYPCPPEHCSVDDCYDFWFRSAGFRTGISDHSGTIWPSVVAAANEMDMCEVHVTWSRECFGPDVPASITIDELRQLVQGVRFLEKMRENPVDKDKMASELSEMREIFCAH